MQNNQSEYLTLAQAARSIPGGVSIPTVWRWSAKGVAGVRLRTARAGRRIVTTEGWLADFYQELGEVRKAERESDGGRCETSRFGGGIEC